MHPTSFVARYPLATFFALAYGISWFFWAPLWLPAFGVLLFAGPSTLSRRLATLPDESPSRP